jgi:hypothetical protein
LPIDPRTWSLRDRVHAGAMLLILIGAVAHNVALFRWYIEDAAISFGFAQNIAEGYGAVVQPGLERLEGYSNPTWLAILVVLHAVGLDLMASVHWVQLLLCLVTVPAAYFAGREVFGRRSDASLLVPAFLAANAQFAIWGQAGLENGLWNLLFVLGFWRTARELRDEEPGRRFPWSAALWLLLALTRPEGILYAAVAGFVHLCWHVVERRTLVPSLQWLAVFFVPWGIYQYLHWLYFAWPFPNTYYAKMTLKEASPYDWNKRPWNWTRSFFLEMGQGFFLPVWLFSVVGQGGMRSIWTGLWFVGLALTVTLSNTQRHLVLAVLASLWFLFWLGLHATGERPSRGLLGAAGVGALGLFLGSEALRWWGHVPNEVPVPDLLQQAPPFVLAAAALVLPAWSFGLDRWALRWLGWWTCWAAVFFAVYSEGDWMKGYRWYAMAAVPAAFLFAWGADAFARWFDEVFAVTGRDGRRWTPAALGWVGLFVVAQLPANVMQTYKVATNPDPSPRGIKPRIDYVQKVMDRIRYDEPIVSVDVDMGAHLIWTDWRMLDIAGLIDIPWAHHKFEKPFVREYLFEEMKPPYIHIHGGWATNSKVPTHPEFKRDYYEIPGFPAGKNQFHIGNYLRRDLLVRPGARPEGTGVVLDRGVIVYPPVVPAEPGQARKFEVHVAFQNPDVAQHKKRGEDDFRVLLFAARDGVVGKVWELPPGWDWLFPHDWHADEQFATPFVLPTGKLPLGTWDLGYVVTWEDGTVLAPAADRPLPPGVVVGGRDGAPAVYARGEVVWPGALTILTAEERADKARQAREAAVAAADAGDCGAAEAAWLKARQHRPGDRDWRTEFQPAIDDAFSGCWARSSDGQDRPEQLRRLMRAKRWSFENPDFASRASATAAALEADGMEAHARQDWETAYDLLSAAVELDGTRSFARRYAEEARGFRLGIDPASLAARDAEEAEKSRAAAKKQRKSTVIGPDHRFVRPARPARAPEPEPTPEEPAEEELGPSEGPR